MTEQTPNANTERQPDTTGQTAKQANAHPGWLRLVPPIAALGTAFVLQVIVITDTVGTSLAKRTPSADGDWIWYLFAGLLGVAVASCAEGGAAYLMDLYDKHLLARDSVWVLRLAMFAYVGASAAVIHWWTDERNLPSVVGWLLAGMSASALFLWSRGSRWRNREEMRTAGQLDPALPRMSIATKVFHPVRWIVTLWLISWEPVQTNDEARARYEQWKNARRAKKQTNERTNEQTHQTDSHPSKQTTTANVRTDTGVLSADTFAETPAQSDSEPQTHPTNTGQASTAEHRTNAHATNVSPIRPGRRIRTSADDTATLERIKKHFPAWRTILPSVRDIGGFLNASNYTGQKFQQMLLAERAAPNTTTPDMNEPATIPDVDIQTLAAANN